MRLGDYMISVDKVLRSLKKKSLKFNRKEITIQGLLDIFEVGYVDFNRQRHGGLTHNHHTGKPTPRGAGWDLKKGKDYIGNLWVGEALNQAIIVDLKSCIAFCEREKLSNDLEYYEKIAKLQSRNIEQNLSLTKYLIEDCHNSMSYIYAFCNNGFTIKLDDIEEALYFKELPLQLQQYFLTREFELITITEATLKQLHTNIIAVNSAMPWSQQDKRNAWLQGNIVEIVRVGADLNRKNDTREAFNPVFTQNAAEKRETDKFYAQHLFYESYLAGDSCTGPHHRWEGNQIADLELDKFYYKVQNISPNVAHRANAILGLIKEMVYDQKDMKKGRWNNFWIMVSKCIYNQYKVTDAKILRDKFLDWLISVAVEEENTQWASDFDRQIKSFEHATNYWNKRKTVVNGLDTNGNDKVADAFYWELREDKIQEWFDSNEQGLTEKGAISKIYKRDPKSNFKPSQKEELYAAGKHKGLSAGDINNINVDLDMCHKTPAVEGGEPTIENGYLGASSENRAEGARIGHRRRAKAKARKTT